MRRIDGRCADAGDQVGYGARHHAGLAQGGQHLVDIVQERGAWSHHQHAGAFQRAAMRVEQVCGTVQRHGGLAGAGASLDHYGAVHLGTDDAVLLGLDRGHDIGHLAGAARTQGCQQRALSGQCAGG